MKAARILNIAGIVVFAFHASMDAAPLRDVPQRLVQPDGAILECFASGDEYHNWLHDENGYTIIRDPSSGYYVYADEQNGELVPTPHVAGRVDPASVGLQAEVNLRPERVLEKRQAFAAYMVPDDRSSPDAGTLSPHQTPPVSTLQNIVVFIRFADELEFGMELSLYDDLYNKRGAGVQSLYEYYQEASYGQLEIVSTFYPESPQNIVISYQDIYPRAHFRPRHDTQNPDGYDSRIPFASGTDENGPTFRVHTLLKRAIEYVESQIPSSLNIDGTNNGRVDCVSFIVRGEPEGWGSILWPQRWVLWSQTATIHGKRVWDYTFQLDGAGIGGQLNLGIVAHEMFHILGAPDLYRYDDSGLEPVGHWDLMAFAYNPPQHMGAYMKYFYGGWIEEIPAITAPGTYQLNPLTSSEQNSFRIPSAASADEYYIVEYRRKNTVYESVLPGEGLIVYRINPLSEGRGNQMEPDEVYIYRPEGTATDNGSILFAHYGAHVGRTAISDFTTPSAFLSDESPGGLFIHDIGNAGETIEFTVGSIPTSVADTEIPQHVMLHQNYPNPFNPTTQIRFTLPEQSVVLLEVYDLLGRRVATIIDYENYSMGHHTVTWNATNQAGRSAGSGIYVYRLKAGSQVETKRMMYLK